LRKGLKKRLRTILLYAAGLCLVAVIAGLGLLGLITRRPGNYHPPAPIDDGQVSPYLTHELAASFYNNLQHGKAFELKIEQEGINDIIARGNWPQQLDGMVFSAPAVVFSPGAVFVMGTVQSGRFTAVVTVKLKGQVDDSRRLRLQVKGVWAGVLNITPLAKAFAQEALRQQADKMPPDRFPGAILSALVNGESFDPVVQVDGKRVRIERITIEQQRLTIRFTPAG